MRLLYVIDSLAPGGAETSLVDMAPGLVSRGTELHVLPLGQRLDLASGLLKAGAQIHSPSGSGGRFGNVQAVREIARSIRPELVHTTLFEADVAGRAAARSLRIPVSTSLVSDSYGPAHYGEHNTMKLHAARALDAATAVCAARFHSITAAIADSVSPRLGIPRSKIDVIPRGRDPLAFPFRPVGVGHAVRASLGIGTDAQVILSVGRLEPPKGHVHLLRALTTLAPDHPHIVVLIAGKEGQSSQSLKRLAAQQAVDVRFLGHRTDVADLLSAADVLCFPSEREGLGGVLIEALATGCPVVASDLPATREVLTTSGEEVGVLTPLDPIALATALDSVLSNRGYAESLAVKGRQRFEDHFMIDDIAHQMVSFFARVERS